MSSKQRLFIARRQANLLICIASLGVLGSAVGYKLSTQKQAPRAISVHATNSRKQECGHFAVRRLALLSGICVTESEIGDCLPVTGQGHSMAELMKACELLGLRPSAKKLAIDFDEGALPVPLLIHLSKPDHFAVVDRDVEGKLVVWDGPIDSHFVTEFANLRRRMSGYTIQFLQQKPSTTGPEISAGSLVRDIGRIGAKTKSLPIRIPLKNGGAGSLVIHDVRSDCGCFKLTFPRTALSHGASGEIAGDLMIAVNRSEGAFARSLRILSNCSRTPQLDITIVGEVDPKLEVSPGVLQLKAKHPGAVCNGSLYVSFPKVIPKEFDLSVTGMTLKSHRVLSAGEAIEAGIIERLEEDSTRVPGRENAIIEMELESPAKTGVSSGELTIKSKTEEFVEARIPISVMVEPWIVASPKRVLFDDGAEKGASRIVTLNCPRKHKYELISIDFDKDAMEVVQERSIDEGEMKLIITRRLASNGKFHFFNIEAVVRLESATKPETKVVIPVGYIPIQGEPKAATPFAPK